MEWGFLAYLLTERGLVYVKGDKINYRIQGKEHEGIEGQTVLQALMGEGIDVPHVCYQPNLGVIQTCDTCIVEVNGKLVRSCSTVLSAGADM